QVHAACAATHLRNRASPGRVRPQASPRGLPTCQRRDHGDLHPRPPCLAATQDQPARRSRRGGESMTAKQKTALVRFGRVLVFGAIATVASALPDLFASIPQEYQSVAVPALTAILAGLDKLRRYGQDPGEVA